MTLGKSAVPKPGELSSIPETHMAEGETWLPQSSTATYMYTWMKYINVNFKFKKHVMVP